MNNIEFVNKAKDIANNYKTLYVMGCFGAPMNSTNKTRYCNNTAYNRDAKRTAMIQAASTDTFGFDCVCLIKGILWGWSGDKTKTYGGAKYNSNGVPDKGADQMIALCSNVTTDFGKIEVGEVVWCKGHIGIYIGNGLAVEATPAWKNCVQITAVKNIGAKDGYNARIWTKHGKLPYIEYVKVADEPVEKPVVETPKKSIDEIAKEVIQGKWGNGAARKSALTKAGYDYATVQARVDEIKGKTPATNTTTTPAAPAKKSIDELAKEVIQGKWGNGAARKSALTKAGYDYATVQNRVDEMLGKKPVSNPAPAPVEKPVVETPKKSIDELAKEVIQGKWGNGAARKSALTKAGYDYAAVQARVDELKGKTTTATNTATKTIDELAKEVIQGKWGNGAARKSALTKAGYDYSAVQKRVDEMLKK